MEYAIYMPELGEMVLPFKPLYSEALHDCDVWTLRVVMTLLAQYERGLNDAPPEIVEIPGRWSCRELTIAPRQDLDGLRAWRDVTFAAIGFWYCVPRSDLLGDLEYDNVLEDWFVRLAHVAIVHELGPLAHELKVRWGKGWKQKYRSELPRGDFRIDGTPR